MPTPDWNDDDELMLDIRRAVAPSAVDDRTLEAGRAAFAWRTVDADLHLAALSYDSDLDEPAPVRGRTGGSHRTQHFSSGDLAVEIELSDTGIEGQLIPPQPGRITVLTPQGPHARTTADEVGCFRFPPLPHGPVRWTCTLEAGTLVTEWTVV